MKASYSPLSNILFLIMLSMPGIKASAQDSTKKDMTVNIGFYDINNRAVYLSIHAKTKIEGRFQPVNGAKFRLYLDKDSVAYITGDVVTDLNGDGRTILLPALKDQWNASATHTFIAISDGNALFNASKTETPITKSRLQIDTGQGHTISGTILELKNGRWSPAKGVDIKVDIRRSSGGDLAAGDKESYTTDSTGKIVAEFKRDSLPGDKNGILTLVAKIDDNDLYGNLQTEMRVPWGSVAKPGFSIDNRTLWGVRSRTPLWLLFMAYSIFFSVWAVLVYLILQLRLIKKAARNST